MAFSTAYMQLSAAASGRDQASVSISPEICGCVGNCRNHSDDFTVALHSHHHHHHHHERDDENLLHLFLEMQKTEDHRASLIQDLGLLLMRWEIRTSPAMRRLIGMRMSIAGEFPLILPHNENDNKHAFMAQAHD